MAPSVRKTSKAHWKIRMLADDADDAEEEGIKDYQLARAVDLLNGLKVFKGVMQ